MDKQWNTLIKENNTKDVKNQNDTTGSNKPVVTPKANIIDKVKATLKTNVAMNKEVNKGSGGLPEGSTPGDYKKAYEHNTGKSYNTVKRQKYAEILNGILADKANKSK